MRRAHEHGNASREPLRCHRQSSREASHEPKGLTEIKAPRFNVETTSTAGGGAETMAEGEGDEMDWAMEAISQVCPCVLEAAGMAPCG